MIAPARFQWPEPDTTEPSISTVADLSWREVLPGVIAGMAVAVWCLVLPVIGLLWCLGVI